LTQQLTDGQWWEDEFDLSALTYPQFLAFFFDRPIVGDENEYDLFRSGIDRFVASNPVAVVAHVRAMCCNFSDLTKVYSHEQLDQGLWAVFGAGISCERFLFDPAVDLRLRVDCIESMYLPFRDVVARATIDKRDSFYWMWWDMILHSFWHEADKFDYASISGGSKQILETMRQRALEFDYAGLSEENKQILEAMYQTLLKTLVLEHPVCQWSALHGLGHLHHPLGPEIVQGYLDVHQGELSKEDVQWIEACRDGQIA
jgi:hypothetical protein